MKAQPPFLPAPPPPTPGGHPSTFHLPVDSLILNILYRAGDKLHGLQCLASSLAQHVAGVRPRVWGVGRMPCPVWMEGSADPSSLRSLWVLLFLPAVNRCCEHTWTRLSVNAWFQFLCMLA